MNKKLFYGGWFLIFIVIASFIFIKEFGTKKLIQKSSRGPLPKGDRILSIGALLSTAEKETYDEALNVARAAGMQTITLAMDWRDIEPAPEYYYLAPYYNFRYYSDKNIKVNISIRPIHTTQKPIPEDLKDKSLDDPLVILRFKKLLDYLFSQIPDPEKNIDLISIGSEFDAYLGNDPELWRQYEIFSKEAGDYIKSHYSEIKVGFEATLTYGFLGDAKEYVRSLNKYSDVIAVSYYPLNEDFTVKDPRVVGDVFAALARAYPDKPIYFLQLGYPTSSRLGSSEIKQKEFIEEVFRAWDKFASNIKFIEFTWLNDGPSDGSQFYVDFYCAGNSYCENFKASDCDIQTNSDNERKNYLCNFVAYFVTLGLRTYPGMGADKEAFKALKLEAKSRGW